MSELGELVAPFFKGLLKHVDAMVIVGESGPVLVVRGYRGAERWRGQDRLNASARFSKVGLVEEIARAALVIREKLRADLAVAAPDYEARVLWGMA